jgi:hypothetical protein
MKNNYYLLIARTLRYLDNYMKVKDVDKRSFYSIYEKYTANLNRDVGAAITNIKDLFKINNYEQLMHELSMIDEMIISETSLRQIRHSMKMSIEKVIEEVIKVEKKINKELDLGQIETLVGYLDLLKKAKKLLDSIGQSSNNFDIPMVAKKNSSKALDETLIRDVEKTTNEIEYSLTEKLKAYLSHIELSIQANDFDQAEEHRDRFAKIHALVCHFLKENQTILNHDSETSVKKRFELIEFELEKIVDNIIKKYQ